MDVKQSYYAFLEKQGAKCKVKSIIEDGIKKWRSCQAYRYESGTDPYTGDRSGNVWMIPDKTIGDIAKTDIEVLMAYTGNREASYASHCGWRFTQVYESISEDIQTCLYHLQYDFILENADALMEEYGIEREPEWDSDRIYENIDEAMYDEYGITDEWMNKEFPEYEMPGDYRFSISNW